MGAKKHAFLEKASDIAEDQLTNWIPAKVQAQKSMLET